MTTKEPLNKPPVILRASRRIHLTGMDAATARSMTSTSVAGQCFQRNRSRMEATAGSVSIEAVMIIPAFLLFMALILAIGRTVSVQADLHASVVAAARIASMQTCALCADTAARDSVVSRLAAEKTPCLNMEISTDTAILDQPLGTPGSVAVTVTCEVPLADLSVPGMPGHIRLTDSFSSSIDPYTPR